MSWDCYNLVNDVLTGVFVDLLKIKCYGYIATTATKTLLSYSRCAIKLPEVTWFYLKEYYRYSRTINRDTFVARVF